MEICCPELMILSFLHNIFILLHFYLICQGEEAAEDTENTDHDVSAVASSLDANSGNPLDPENILDIMDHLLERTVNENSNAGRNHAMEIDEDGNLAYDHERDTVSNLKSHLCLIII